MSKKVIEGLQMVIVADLGSSFRLHVFAISLVDGTVL